MNLHFAAKSGDLKSVIDLHERGLSLDICDDHQNTPLHYAAKHGHYEVAAYLIGKKCSLNVANSDGNTPLWIAVDAGHSHVASLRSPFGATSSLRLPCGGWLLDQVNSDGEIPLSLAFRNLKIAELLIRSGADIHSLTEENHRSLLHTTCDLEYPDIVRAIVERYPGYDVDSKCSGRWFEYTPMLYAAKYGKKDMVNLFLELGADVNACDHNKMTVLHLLCDHSWTDVIKKCIEAGADLNAQSSFGSTPLHLECSMGGDMEIMKVLLDAGANVNIRNNWNDTALNNVLLYTHLSCALSDCNCPNRVRMLVDRGAIIDQSAYEVTCHEEYGELKRRVFGDVGICTQALINKFNNVDLPSIYRIPSSVKLPSVKKLKIKTSHGAAREIEKCVANEVEAKGFCNVVEKCPPVLQILSVRSFLNYYENRL